MKKLRLVSVILTLMIFTTNVSASILGSTLITGYTLDVANGTTVTNNVWYSDQNGVGQQTENYIIYKPNKNVEPIITNGTALFGKRNINSEVSRIKKEGLNPIAGINADYFSLETGVPMSNIIKDGKILTKDSGDLYGIGILEDNTAFMSKFNISSVLEKEDGSKIDIHNINKYRQPYSIYMFTTDFLTETKNSTLGIDVILKDVEGEMKIGSKITAVVESATEYGGSIAIPDGKIVLSVDKNAPTEFYEQIASLKPDEKIEITFEATGDDRWKDAKIGLGATGGVLIENGEIGSGFEIGAHPRTALGILEDGSILLYTLDGRQKGYSYGAQLKTLASRLKELGCVDAINLDGGGSTSFVVQLPGDNTTTLTNKPSEGKPRSVANFIFLNNNQKPSGKLKSLTIYPLTSYVLAGAKLQFTTKATDTTYHPLPTPSNLQYSVEDDDIGSIDNNGLFTAKDNGKTEVQVKSGKIIGKTNVVCVKTPTDIKIKDKSNSKYITTLNIKRTDNIELIAEAYAGYNLLTSDQSNYTWSCDKNIGEIDSNGKFTASNQYSAKGNIYVTAGEKTVEIPVNVTENGKETDDELYPSIEFDDESVKISNKLGIEIDKNDIIVRADGKSIDFEYKDGNVLSDNYDNINKLTIYATNSLGYTSFKTTYDQKATLINKFIDTNEHWAKDIISYMNSIKIVNGENTTEGLKFNPNKPMTRSEFAVMITNYLDVDTTKYESIELPYSDLDKIPNWALNSFKTLHELGIIKGAVDDEGNVYANPTSNITRAEASTIITRTLPDGIKHSEVSATDVDLIADWAFEGISKLISTGAINGYEDGTIRPTNKLTKAEAVKILFSII